MAEQKAWKKYECGGCGGNHWVGINIDLSNGVTCGKCGETVYEEHFEQVEIFDGKVENDKKPVETYATVEEWEND